MGVIAYYPFKNGSLENLVGVGGNANNNGALFNNTLGKDSYYFNNGSTTYINHLGINIPQVCSFSAWNYQTNTSGQMLFYVYDGGGFVGVYFSGINIYWNIGDGSNNPFRKNGVNVTTPALNEWHHYVITCSTTEIMLYIDGIYVGSAITYRNPTRSNIVIGNYHTLSGYPNSGYIANFRIYNHTLSPTEVTNLYKNHSSENNVSLIAHYPLNGNTDDYSGNGFNATNSGAIIDNNGKIGKCYSFTSGNTITTNNTNLNNLEHFTICLWHYFTDVTYPRTFSPIYKNNGYTYYDGISNRGWDFGHGYSSSSVRVEINDGVNKVLSDLTFDVGNRPSDLINKWVHLTYEVNRIDKKVYAYVNGVKQSTSVDISNITGSISNNGVLRIGKLYGWYLIGKLNDIRIYNGVLSPKEIKEIAKAKILHYAFDDFQEPTVNLVTNQNFITNWTGSNPPLSVFDGVGVFGEANGDQYWYNSYNFGVDISGKIFTASCKMKTIDCEKPKGISIYWTDVNNNLIFQNLNWTYIVSQNSLDYNFLSVSSTAPAGAYRALFFIGMYYTNVVDANGRMFIKDCMLEEKDHPTNYTPTTRTGQVQDSSGYKNHAILNLVTTPQWSGLSRIGNGGYKFAPKSNDGVNNYNNCNVISCETISLPNDAFAFSFWTYRTASGYQGGSYFRLGEYGGSGIDTYDVGVDLFSSGTQIARLIFDVQLNEWVHNVITFDREILKLKVYANGVFIRETNVTDLPIYNITNKLDIGISLAGGALRCFNGTMDDFRIYATALSQEDITELYEVGQQIHNTGILETNEVIENGYGHTLVNYNKWVVGDFVYQDGWDNHWGGKPTQYSDLIALYSNPQGEQDLVYESKVLDNTFVMYRTRGLAATPTLLPDITKTYRLSCWVYISGNTTSGTSWYAGLDYSKVCNINTTTPNSNPYQHVLSGGVSTGDKWILCVSYIYPYGSIGNVNNAKRYLPDGTIHSTGTDYNWNSGISSFFLRWLFNYQYDQPNVNQYTLLYRPRFDLIDGTEPTLQELLKCQDHKPFPLIQPEFSEKHYTYINKYKEAFTTGITYIKDDNGVSQQLYCEYLEGQVYAKSNTTDFVVKGVTFSNYLQLIDTNIYIYKERVIANMDSNTIYVNELIEN